MRKGSRCSTLPNVGFFMAAVSSFFYSIASVIVKMLVEESPLVIVMFRFVIVLLLTLPLLVCSGNQLFPRGQRFMLVLRGMLATITAVLQYYAFKHMPLADASVIIFSVPVFVAVFALIFLGEPCGLLQSGVIVITSIGVVIIARPPLLFGSYSEAYTAENWWGIAAAIASAAVAGSSYIIIRKLKDIHFSVQMFCSFAVTFLITLSLAYVSGDLCVPHCGKNRYLAVAFGVLSFADLVTFTMALQLEQAGTVSVIRAGDVLFAFVWQAVFFNKLPDLLSLLGALLITAGVVIMGLHKWLFSLPESSALHCWVKGFNK